MRRLGNKVAARNLAIEIGVPVVPATEPLPDDMDEVRREWPRRDGISRSC
jgi:pyruvate carboxylase